MNRQFELKPDEWIENDRDQFGLLRCPGCGEPNGLHHYKTEVFERAEDATKGAHVTVTDESVHIDSDINDNPSDRRHGLKVWLWCELCPAISVFTIAQHKGQTLLDLAVSRAHTRLSEGVGL